jgi:dTDP-4-dehydrorhamnose reductase
VKKFKPDYLFHIGAFTDLEFCEENVDDTYSTNTLSVENAVYISNKLNIPLLYISTAGIFDGKKDLYDDWDLPNPLGVYARSNFMGERYVCENSNSFLHYTSSFLSRKILGPLCICFNIICIFWFFYKLNFGIWGYDLDLSKFLIFSYSSL